MGLAVPFPLVRVYVTYTSLGAVHKCQHFNDCKNHTLSGGRGSVKISIFSVHFKLFGLIFIIFTGIFGTPKMLMCTLSLGGGRESQKVYGLYIHENVDIYGQPLTGFIIRTRQNVLLPTAIADVRNGKQTSSNTKTYLNVINKYYFQMIKAEVLIYMNQNCLNCFVRCMQQFILKVSVCICIRIIKIHLSLAICIFSSCKYAMVIGDVERLSQQQQ